MAVYVDDTTGSGDPVLEKRTERIQKTFESKKKEFSPFIFVVTRNYRRSQHTVPSH